MKAAVVAPSPVPFRRGGAERLWQGLVSNLRIDHEVELIKIPVREHTLVDLVAGYRTFSRLDLTHFDLVITGKYPAWAVDHPAHVVWMLHPLRGLYDSWDPATFVDDTLPGDPAFAPSLEVLASSPAGAAIGPLLDAVDHAAAVAGPEHDAFSIPSVFARAVVQWLDRACLDRRRIRRHAAISRTVAERPGYFPPDVTVDVCHPPSDLPVIATGPPGDVFVTVSRLERIKRVDLVIDAVARAGDQERLVVAGDGPDRGRLEQVAGPGVTFAGALDDAELSQLYSSARAVIVAPEREDFGLVALEAMQHGRAVITTSDSGGVTELVEHGRTGLIVAPDPDDLAAAVRSVTADVAARMGAAGRDAASAVTWPRVVSRLLEPRRRSRPGRPKIVVAGTYPIHPRDKGGARRCAELYRGLTEFADVEAVTLSPHGPLHRGTVYPCYVETSVPMSSRHVDAESRLRAVAGPGSITDIAAARLAPATPAFMRELDAALDDASAVLLAHPYLVEAVTDLRDDLPLIYDAHNDEVHLKSATLPDDEAGHWLLGQVRRAEDAAVTRAELVVATTVADRDRLARRTGRDPATMVVIPNGVDTGAVQFVTGDERRRAREAVVQLLPHAPEGGAPLVLFVGSAHGPNIAAGQLVAGMASRLAPAHLVLAGRHSDHVQSSAPNVARLGAVDEDTLMALLHGCAVGLNPVTGGGGSNLKMLDYFAAGCPVVSTPEGARGLEHPERMALLAPLSGFPAAVRAVLESPHEAAARAEAARAVAEADHDWTVLGRRFAECVRDRLGW